MDKVIDSLASRIANFFVVNKHIPKEQEELYKYSALIAIQSFINIISTLLIGLIFRMFISNLIFFLLFKVLRKFSGGLHSSKFSACFLISVVSNVFVLLTMKIFESNQNYSLIIVIELASLFIVLIFAPVANENKPISLKQFKIFKLVGCLISFALVLISIALSINNCRFVIAMGFCLCYHENSFP